MARPGGRNDSNKRRLPCRGVDVLIDGRTEYRRPGRSEITQDSAEHSVLKHFAVISMENFDYSIGPNSSDIGPRFGPAPVGIGRISPADAWAYLCQERRRAIHSVFAAASVTFLGMNSAIGLRTL